MKNDKYKSIIDNISNDTDLYFVIMMVLSSLHKDSQYGSVADLVYLLDSKSFSNLLYYFEGQTLKIPTRAEFTFLLNLLKLYYYNQYLGNSLKESIKLCKLYGDTTKYVKSYNELLDTIPYMKFPTIMEDQNE